MIVIAAMTMFTSCTLIIYIIILSMLGHSHMFYFRTQYDVAFQVTDVDIGTNAEVDLSLEAGQIQQLFSLVLSDPSTVQLHLAQQLDREMQEFYSFRIFARDRGSPSLIGQTEVFITVVVSYECSAATIYAVSLHHIASYHKSLLMDMAKLVMRRQTYWFVKNHPV